MEQTSFSAVDFGVDKNIYLEKLKSIFDGLGIQFNYQKAIDFYQHKNTVRQSSVNIPNHIQDLYEELLRLSK